jgi:hypothetical protein
VKLTVDQKVVVADTLLNWLLFELQWRRLARDPSSDEGEVIYHDPEALR